MGDITTQSLKLESKLITSQITSKSKGILSGNKVAKRVFQKIDEKIVYEENINDGEELDNNTIVANITGNENTILAAERTALNFLQRMSGVATETSRYSQKAFRKNIHILDTRKTTPGIRIFEKYASKCGGGANHRFNLSEGVMIKDNHIGSNKSINSMFKKYQKPKAPIQVEIDTIDQLNKVLKYKIDAVLLDNMNSSEIKKCIGVIKESGKKIFIEVSGGINYKTLNKYLIPGVDAISIGATIHQATFKNIKLEFC